MFMCKEDEKEECTIRMAMIDSKTERMWASKSVEMRRYHCQRSTTIHWWLVEVCQKCWFYQIKQMIKISKLYVFFFCTFMRFVEFIPFWTRVRMMFNCFCSIKIYHLWLTPVIFEEFKNLTETKCFQKFSIYNW